MPKELPYFKFEPSEWLEGKIQICSDKTISCFINLIAAYWSKSGCISYAFALHKYCRKDKDVLQELIDNHIIHLNNDEICIKFLDLQLEEVRELSEKRSQSAKKRWSNANAMQLHSKSNAIREDKIREDKNSNMPDLDSFVSYALQKRPDVDELSVKMKYESWKENGWKDNNGKEIKNWKTKLLNTLPYLKQSDKKIKSKNWWEK